MSYKRTRIETLVMIDGHAYIRTETYGGAGILLHITEVPAK